MSGLNRFLGELKRRNVYRVAVGYSVAALALVEAVELVLPRLGFSEQVVTFVLVAAMLGFPVALVLAWVYEVTSDGVVAEESVIRGNEGERFAAYLAAAATLVVVAGAGWWLVTGRLTDVDVAPGLAGSLEVKSIAVLPFRDLSQDGDQEWLGHGLAEEILGALNKVPDLRVVARESSFALADQTIAEIGGRLGATHVLSGSVRSDGSVARIRAQLIDVDGERGIWSRDFQPELGGVLDAQEEIARAVVDALELELGAIADTQLMLASTTDPRAHENYLRGLQLWNRRSEPEILSAIDHFRVAVGLDPDYAAAWAGLSYAYLVLPEYSPTADVARVREQSATAAARALEIEPEQPDALTAMGWGRMIHQYDWEGAEDLIGRALSLDSANVNALHWHSHVLSWRGRHDEAVALARTASSIDPLSSIMRENLAFILMEAQGYEEALHLLDQVVGPEPDFTSSYRTMWNLHTRVGRYAEASEALEAWLTRTGRDAVAARDFAVEFASKAQRFREAGLSSELTVTLLDRLQPGLEVEGQLHAAVGDVERTIAVLEQAYRERAGARNLLSIKVNPLYDFMRSDRRFAELVRRIGLLPATEVGG